MKGEYRPEIDGLRAVAVLAATFNNFWEEILPCGYLGVDMFAVISGYVITGLFTGGRKIVYVSSWQLFTHVAASA